MKISRIGNGVTGAARVAIALALAGGIAGCDVMRVVQPWAPSSSTTTAESARPPMAASQWIGKTVPELTAKLGQPDSTQPLLQTTGSLIMYSRPGAHYVFETGPSGQIVSAAATN